MEDPLVRLALDHHLWHRKLTGSKFMGKVLLWGIHLKVISRGLLGFSRDHPGFRMDHLGMRSSRVMDAEGWSEKMNGVKSGNPGKRR
jgi:hypothetical protein